MDKQWQDEFFDLMGEHTPDSPRHVRIGIVESVSPLEINLDGIIYEKLRGEILINNALLMHEVKEVKINGIPQYGELTINAKAPDRIKKSDRVAVVQMDGLQQILVLCKVV